MRASGAALGVSYRIVECSSWRRSNARNDPSAPTDTKMSLLCGSHDKSYTALSCAMSCVSAWDVLMSHSVAVVSVEHVTMLCGAFGFQLKLVIGGKFDGFCLLCSLSAPACYAARLGLATELTFERKLLWFSFHPSSL